MFLLVSLALLAAPAQPDWVDGSGRSTRYPIDRYLSGYAYADGDGALERARLAAAAEVARTLSVRIETQLTDLSTLEGGRERQELAALNKASSDVRLDGLSYESFTSGDRVYALAVLERAPAAVELRRGRDASVATLREALRSAAAAEKEKRDGDALKSYLAARTRLGEALRQETLARALTHNPSADWPALEAELAAASRTAADRVEVLMRSSHANLREAVDALGLQLHAQGISNKGKWLIAPFTYRATIYPSLFGREAAMQLERALAQASEGDTGGSAADVAFKGTYTDEADQVRLIVYAREVQSGRTLASAESALPKSAIPADLPLAPPNLMQALRDQQILAAGEEVPGALKVELFTNKESAGESTIFLAGEEMKLFVRVNKPCYVRLVYLLQSGYKVPLAQAWYIPEANVNKLVEFTDTFEIAPPFGSESIQAAAFTDKPEPLATKSIKLEGTDYDVVADGTGALIKHRGIVRKKASEAADTVLSITTMPVSK